MHFIFEVEKYNNFLDNLIINIRRRKQVNNQKRDQQTIIFDTVMSSALL